MRSILALAFVLAACAPEALPVSEVQPVAVAPVADTDPAMIEYDQLKLLIGMHLLYPNVEAKIVWKDCGEVNSFYFPEERTVVLCREMIKLDRGMAMFAAAHEMGHAIATQLAGTQDEHAADEIGALAMLRLGYADDEIEAAFFMRQQVIQAHLIGDSHPSWGYRAWELACLELGQDGRGSTECNEFFRAKTLEWWFRLHDEQMSPFEAWFRIHENDKLVPVRTTEVK